MKNRILNTLSATTIAVGLLTGATTAWAQNNSVIVDMSILPGGMYGAIPYTAQNSDLLMPDASMPSSSYFGPPVDVSNPQPVVSAPVITTATSNATLSNADNVPPPVPQAAPQPEVVSVVPEAPAETAMSEPEPMEAPEPEAVSEPMEITTEAIESSSDTMTTEMTTEAEIEIVETGTAEAETAPPPPPEETAQVEETVITETVQQDAMATSTEAEIAVVTSGDVQAAPGLASRILFAEGDAKLPENAKPDLDAVASAAGEDENLRIQLMAYAGGDDLSSSKARRVSLSRALAVRSYLIEQGIRPTRIDVRALGDKNPDESQPVNRVDVDITER